MRRSKGFTLIELMIVIAIIAIIAAIAIPGLLQSQRAANERNASASLKTMATANSDFRSNDRDGNKVNDFWVLDVAGLFTAYPPGATSSSAIKLIEVSIAAADITNNTAAAGSATLYGTTNITVYQRSSPKSGYWYYALASDGTSGTAVLYGTDTDASTRLHHNNSSFGFGGYPDSFSSGRQVFIINEGNTMFKRQTIANVKPAVANPPANYALAAGLAGAGDRAATWPTDTSLKADYGKMD